MAIEEHVWIPTSDGVRLNAKLYRPDGDGPFPVVIEALPYRKDDVTSYYESEYRRLRDEGGYAVCRIDVRGTGTSEGIALDEYLPREQEDLCQAIEWLAAQPWSNGTVGMYGTSYSGFNSLQVAMHRPPALKAIVSIFATDARYTDDVHFGGGAQRGIDLVDYPLYMVAMNALPPTPELFGENWREEWSKRLQDLEPWVMTWLEEQNETEYWLQGSLKTNYSSIEAATMVIAGWADGYHNMGFRTIEQLDAPSHLLAGPWSHMATENSIPGPHIDLVPELIAWWDRWLKDDESSPAASWPKVRAYMRRYTKPEPDLWIHEGEWWSEPVWPPERAATETRELGEGSDDYEIVGDVGFYGSIWCAGTMPWGPPMDQREDDARSLTYEWPVNEADGEIAILGHPFFDMTVRSSVPVTYVSAKLVDVAPDGTAALVSRGLLNLTHRDSHADPKPLVPGETYSIALELDATSWIFEPGHTIRLSVSTSDWPSSWSPPLPGTITIERDESRLRLPLLPGGPIAPAPEFTPPRPEKNGRAAEEAGQSEGGSQKLTRPVVWREEHDVLARERRTAVEYGVGVPDPDDPLQVWDIQEAVIGVSTTDPGRAWVQARAVYSITWPEVKVTNEARIRMDSDAENYKVVLELDVNENDEPRSSRRWEKTIPRNLQ